MNITFMGLGRMGAGMAHRIADSKQHHLTVWNRSADKTHAFANKGIKVVLDPAEAVATADLVITSLMDDRSVEQLFDAKGEVLCSMQKNAMHLCVTTISPACADRLQQLHATRGLRFVSGPVLGRPDVSASGKLIQFLAGNRSAIEEISPVSALFTQQIMPLLGTAGIANGHKLCINFFVISLIETMGECFTLAEKLQVPRAHLAMFLEKSLPVPGIQVYVDKLFRRDTTCGDGFSMQGGRKDVALMLDAAASVQCPLPLAEVIAEKMDAAIAAEMGHLDWSAIQEITCLRAGI